MFNLIIDRGNSKTKLAVFNGRDLCLFERFSTFDKKALEAVWHQFPIQNYSISTVQNDLEEIRSYFPDHMHYKPFHTGIRLGLQSNYQTMDTLGLDRWAKVLAVAQLYPQKNALIIDAGTCLTFDMLTAEGFYQGGSISLGIQMRFKALAEFTGKLPLVDWNQQMTSFPGRSTSQAISAGVLDGTLQEILGIVSRLNKEMPNLLIFLTGGDADFLIEQLKNSIFASQLVQDPYLVVKGINEAINFEYV